MDLEGWRALEQLDPLDPVASNGGPHGQTIAVAEQGAFWRASEATSEGPWAQGSYEHILGCHARGALGCAQLLERQLGGGKVSQRRGGR